MNVNCKVSLTDEQRNVMFRKLKGGKGMVSRKDVNAFVEQKIEECLNGGTLVPMGMSVVEITEQRDFKPSRGDEPYVFKAKDESLRAIHSRMLDWEALPGLSPRHPPL
jgi:hypothetical protein